MYTSISKYQEWNCQVLSRDSGLVGADARTIVRDSSQLRGRSPHKG